MPATFQFTHPRRVRHFRTVSTRFSSSFNSRTRVGCDFVPAPAKSSLSGFNSRTRVGCDKACLGEGQAERGFNSRTRVGCDSPSDQMPWQTHRFNSRTRVGCDIRIFTLSILVISFNSRTRVGCDSTLYCPPNSLTAFQFTHPRRVRPKFSRVATSYSVVSIHAPA